MNVPLGRLGQGCNDFLFVPITIDIGGCGAPWVVIIPPDDTIKGIKIIYGPMAIGQWANSRWANGEWSYILIRVRHGF